MKTDKYTKVLLTIIAFSLLNLSLRGLDFFPKAYAGEGNDAGLQYGLIPLNEDGSITVKLSGIEEIDVNITDISTTDELKIDLSEISTSDELDINLEEVGGHFVHASEGILVKVKD